MPELRSALLILFTALVIVVSLLILHKHGVL